MFQTCFKLQHFVLGRWDREGDGRFPERVAIWKFPGGSPGVIRDVVDVHTIQYTLVCVWFSNDGRNHTVCYEGGSRSRHLGDEVKRVMTFVTPFTIT